MFCPTCGADNEEGSRFCASCGRQLPRESAEARGSSAAAGSAESGSAEDGGDRNGRGFKGWVDRLVGTSRQARLVSAGIAVALVVAVVAFIALGSDKETTVPQDGLTKAMDAGCVRHKIEIAKAQRVALQGGSLTSVSTYADSVVRIAGDWRRELGRIDAPDDRAELIEDLRAALLEAQIESGALARAARESDKAEVAASAARVDTATANVEESIQNLELERCGDLVFGTGRLFRE